MQAGHETERQSSDIPTLNVIVAVWWRLIDDADSGWWQLTLFPQVAPKRFDLPALAHVSLLPRPSRNISPLLRLRVVGAQRS